MRKIADRIDYSPTAIYLYFKDKNAILETLIEEGFLLLCECIEASQTIADPLERLTTGARHYLRFARVNPHYYRLMFEMADCPKKPQIDASGNETPHVGQQAFGFIRRCVSEGIAQGRFRTDFEEMVLSHNAWAHIHGAVALLLANRLEMLTPQQQESFFESMVETGVRGLLPDCP